MICRELTLSIYSLNGRLLNQDRFNPVIGLYRVDLSDIPPGYYILKVADNHTVFIQKISVIK